MRSGRLRHKITFQKKTETPDGYGGQTIAWIDVATRRAEIQPINGKEYIAANSEQAESNIRITLRYDTALLDLSPAWQISQGSKIYDIQHISNIKELNRELQIMVKLRVE